MQIAEIRNPRLFQNLVRALMLADRGASRYQVVDDAGGDNGLDGYDRQTGELHAIYCPEKPERLEVERDRLVGKFRRDLTKGVRLRDEFGYEARVFAFITPSVLREPLQRQIRDEVRRAGFEDGICISGEALQITFEQHRYLLEYFPELALPRLEPQLAAIREAVERLSAQRRSGTTSSDAELGIPDEAPADEPRLQPYDRFLLTGVESPEVEEVEEALGQGDDAAIERLPVIRAQTTDARVLVAAALVEQGHWFHKHDTARAIAACEEGIRHAHRLGMLAEEATLRAFLARNLAVLASAADLQHTTVLVASARAGMPLAEPTATGGQLERLRALTVRMEREINEALRIVQGGGAYNLDAMYWTYSMVGAIEAYTLSPRLMLANLGYGGADEIAAARARILAAHEAAIRVSTPNGPPSQIRGLENAANDLRLAGEQGPALAFARRALQISAESGVPAHSAAILVGALERERTASHQ